MTTLKAFVTAVAPRTSKIEMASVFLKEEAILIQNGILYFVFKLGQSSKIVLQS